MTLTTVWTGSTKEGSSETAGVVGSCPGTGKGETGVVGVVELVVWSGVVWYSVSAGKQARWSVGKRTKRSFIAQRPRTVSGGRIPKGTPAGQDLLRSEAESFKIFGSGREGLPRAIRAGCWLGGRGIQRRRAGIRPDRGSGRNGLLDGPPV